MNSLLGASIALNLCAIALALLILRRRGGLAYLRQRFLADGPRPRVLGPIEKAREDIWAAMPACEGGWLFLGDSLIDFAPLPELFDFTAISRGRAGDTIADAAVRLAEVQRHRPVYIIVWIGLNDLVLGRSGEDILQGILALVTAIRAGNPSAGLAVMGVPLVSRAQGEQHAALNQIADTVNRALQARLPGPETIFIEPRAALADAQGALRPEFTCDGTHLNGAGYRAWRDLLLRHLAV